MRCGQMTALVNSASAANATVMPAAFRTFCGCGAIEFYGVDAGGNDNESAAATLNAETQSFVLHGPAGPPDWLLKSSQI